MPISTTSRSPPVLDFSAFYGSDAAAKQKLVAQVRECCLHNGFFQITGHRIPSSLQEKVMDCSKRFFDLSLDEKTKISKANNSYNRGYELLHSQILEEGTAPELKEGLYLGEEIPSSHPYFVNKKLNSGPNQWPTGIDNLEEFQQTTMTYYASMFELAKDVLAAVALTLDLPEDYFGSFVDGAVAAMRFLHYPPQPPDSNERLTRGVGAHTDFGSVTLLLQDEVDGLQVWDRDVEQWFDVLPVKGAYVVNLGNMMQRWSNDRYKSNLHRVINKSGKERYSIPFFFNGNPDYVIDCLPNCAVDEPANYPPITVTAAILGGYNDSYGRAERYKQTEAGKAATKRVGID
ncbi:hypothetical protein BDY21DRAFT_384514 [Lineolata rhizophorae]|uniref:Fe2OG dioxygenase domain-containing protein n=1 Tax=Lineolata rhizophorae TaxID=578093 RepID=A0A6A6P8F9_9PEZI|nr:hypothetical protein BDY21DRAFT_384514 [Lineolata rhizophorae]